MEHPHKHTSPPEPELRTAGRRRTRQRTLIWEALTAEPDRHLSADQIVEYVQRTLPQVNPSTIYRTLDLLLHEGLVLRTDLGADRAYYEPAREHPHHHLVCNRCGTITHLHDDALGDLRQHIESVSGYQLDDTEITFRGVCPDCQDRGILR